jgi:DNA-binding phage protein
MLTFKQWFKQLKDDIFEIAFEPTLCGMQTINELAKAADLSWMTVQRLYDGKTKQPRLETIHKLCRAVGMDLRCVKPPHQKRKAS